MYRDEEQIDARSRRPWHAEAAGFAAGYASAGGGGRVATAPLGTARVSKKISPGQPGALRWQNKFGGQLVCVRYRDDPANGRRVTTVELLVDERPLPTGALAAAAGMALDQAAAEEPLVTVLTYFGEVELRRRAIAAGGRWDNAARGWKMTPSQAAAAGLQHRITAEG